MRYILKFLFIILIMLVLPRPAFAGTKAAGSSAKLIAVSQARNFDNREEILRSYLLEKNSPLSNYASDFVMYADKYRLDWRLVASIAGLESSFGQRIPYNSYNAWGWGVYGDNVIRFGSWSEGIETISKGLRERYLGNLEESNPYMIGPKYAASPTWAQRVNYFMQSIREYEISNAKDSIALNI